MAKVWGLWNGGPNYVFGEVEEFRSFAQAKRVFGERLDGWDPVSEKSCPCVSDSEMLVYWQDPEGMADPYPGCILQEGERGGVAVVDC